MNKPHDFSCLLIPEDIRQLLVKIFAQHFYVTLVGGAIRDFLLSGKLPHDLDFELRSDSDFSDDILKRLANLGKELESEAFVVEYLAFGIFRVHLKNGRSVEFAPPRLEFYKEGQTSYAHDEFEVQIKLDLDYVMSWSRRDFTINAMGIELRSMEQLSSKASPVFIDPFGGAGDLDNAILSPCGANFAKDPVRLLRAIRFLGKMGTERWRFSKKLETAVQKVSLEKLSFYYLLSEALKSGMPFNFFRNFFLMSKNFSWGLPQAWIPLSHFADIDSHSLVLSREVHSLEELVLEMCFDVENFSDDFVFVFLDLAQRFVKDAKALRELVRKLNNPVMGNFSIKDIATDLQCDDGGGCTQNQVWQELLELSKVWKRVLQSQLFKGHFNLDIFCQNEDLLFLLKSLENLSGLEDFEAYTKTNPNLPPEQLSMLRLFFHLRKICGASCKNMGN